MDGTTLNYPHNSMMGWAQNSSKFYNNKKNEYIMLALKNEALTRQTTQIVSRKDDFYDLRSTAFRQCQWALIFSMRFLEVLGTILEPKMDKKSRKMGFGRPFFLDLCFSSIFLTIYHENRWQIDETTSFFEYGFRSISGLFWSIRGSCAQNSIIARNPDFDDSFTFFTVLGGSNVVFWQCQPFSACWASRWNFIRFWLDF